MTLQKAILALLSTFVRFYANFCSIIERILDDFRSFWSSASAQNAQACFVHMRKPFPIDSRRPDEVWEAPDPENLEKSPKSLFRRQAENAT